MQGKEYQETRIPHRIPLYFFSVREWEGKTAIKISNSAVEISMVSFFLTASMETNCEKDFTGKNFKTGHHDPLYPIMFTFAKKKNYFMKQLTFLAGRNLQQPSKM